SYAYVDGTSFAAPLVSGAASLLFAYKPDLTNEDVKNILINSCDKLPEMQGANFTNYCGYGRINLKKAMQLLESPYVLTHGNATLTKIRDNESQIFTDNPILATGTYYADCYQLSVDRDDVAYLEPPMAWVSKGYSGANPNNSQEYLNVSTTTASVNAYTFFYYVRTDFGGNPINLWLPYNPSAYYTILGKVAPKSVTLSISLYEGGSGGTYKVNGINVGESWSGTVYAGQTIEAIPPSQQYIFYQWSDGNTSNPRIVTSNLNVYANYKGVHLSNDALAFSNNSQRKLIETKTGSTTWLHQVYASMGHVWIEHSSNGGRTWVLGNNGQPLDGTVGGKNT
ncbi:MAG: S8 family serine peptidase, partial [Mobilitalea sp.]